MKKVLIIFNNSENMDSIDYIDKTLKRVFENYIDLTNCYLDEIEEDTILQADAILVTTEEMLHIVKKYVKDYSKIIKVNRSPSKESLKAVSQIPAKTNVLVVNDTYENTLQTAYSFYEIGVGHINLIPYDESLESTGLYRNITVAITPSEADLVPPYINNIIDIGYRQISFGTMLKLMRMLDLDIDRINRNLFRHIHAVIEPNTDFHDNYIDSHLKSQMLHQIVNNSTAGIILMDCKYQTVFANKRALEIFQVSSSNSIDLQAHMSKEFLSSDEAVNAPVMILDQNYFYDRYTLTLMDEIAGYYISLQDESEGGSAKHAIRAKGFTAKYHFKDLIYRSSAMANVIAMAKKIALTDYTILICGESGTGKELIAQSIHNYSNRKNAPFVAVNCAALPESLLESELFGYASGSFTGAQRGGKPGLFEQANGGTIFLDEIGDISPGLQARLLRVLQERQVMRIGSEKIVDIDTRIFSATNKDLKHAVANGSFRGDLFYRLNVLPLDVPPLRERKDDIQPLLEHFLGEEYKNIAPDELNILAQYQWPGNIRELENATLYFKSLSAFPEYLMKSQRLIDPVPESELSHMDVIHTILTIVEENTQPYHGIGRTALVLSLKEAGLEMSDGKLRQILGLMQEKNWLTIGKGRSGTRITEKGIAYLNTDKS